MGANPRCYQHLRLANQDDFQGAAMTKNILQQTGIYAIRNITNGKCYVGQSVNIKERHRHHFRMLNSGTHHSKHLQRTFNKSGVDALELVVLELCEVCKLTEREQFWMDTFKPTGIYNSAPAAGSPLGMKHSKESREKMSLAKSGSSNPNFGKARSEDTKTRIGLKHKGKVVSEEARRKISIAKTGMTGKPASDETKKKMSEARMGYKPSAEAIEKMAKAKLGRKASEETKQKMRESQAKIKDLKSAKAKAQWANPIAIANISEKRKGRVTSEETKEKLRTGLKERWRSPEYKAKMAKKMSEVRIYSAKSQSNTMKEKWADPEYRKYMMEARANKQYN